MKRKILDSLCEWRTKNGRMPLVLNGARQVGKTYILEEFGKQYYTNTVRFNLEADTRARAVFEDDLNPQNIILQLESISSQRILPHETLLILDEIQASERALTALKSFCEQAPEYHVCAAGSMLGVAIHKENYSFPVGKVDVLNLFPMTLTEFVLALGNKQAAEMLQNGDMKTASSINSFFIEMLRKYYYVGGMPAAVKEFAENGKPNEVRKIQKQILSDYRRDFSKHTSRSEAERIAMVWDAIPQQLAKENKKFKYSDVKQGSRANDFLTSIQWLMDAGLIYKITRINKSARPLRFYEEPSVFKLFLNDVGLLGALMDVSAKDILLGDKVFSEYKGALSEQYVLSQLITSEVPIHYYSSNDSQVEVDFIVQTESRIIPIEVKAEKNVHSKSLRVFIEKNPELKGVRLSMLPFEQQEWMDNIPLYCISKLMEDFQ